MSYESLECPECGGSVSMSYMICRCGWRAGKANANEIRKIIPRDIDIEFEKEVERVKSEIQKSGLTGYEWFSKTFGEKKKINPEISKKEESIIDKLKGQSNNLHILRILNENTKSDVLV